MGSGLSRQRLFVFYGLLLGLALIYSNAITGSFQFDDEHIKVRPNLHLTELSLKSLSGTLYFTPEKSQINRPLPGLSLALNYYFGRYNPMGYHIVNVAIHFLCSLMVYAFVRALLSIPVAHPGSGQRYCNEIAIITAFLFAFHPLQTNVATYIIQRMAGMAALFYLISVTAYINFRKEMRPSQSGKGVKQAFRLGICIISAIAAFLSKENTIVLPGMLLGIDYLFFYPLEDKRRKRILFWLYLTLIALGAALIIGLGHSYYIASFLKGYSQRDFTLTQRLLTQYRVVWFYLYLIIVPNINQLNFQHDFSLSTGFLSPPQTGIAIVAMVILLAMAILLRKRHNLLALAVFWYFGNLVVESSVIPLEMIYEHRSYLPGVMVFCMLALGIVVLCNKVLKRPRAILLTALILILYGNATYLRNRVFQTPLTFWGDVVAKSPLNYRAHNNLGQALLRAGNPGNALREYEIAHRLKPQKLEPLLNLGKMAIKIPGKEQYGLDLIKEALKRYPRQIDAYVAIAEAYYTLQRFDEAESAYELALEKLPFFTPTIYGLGLTRFHLGKLNQAAGAFRQGIEIDPSQEAFYIALAGVLDSQGEFDSARKILQRCIATNGNSAKIFRLIKRLKKMKKRALTIEK